MTPNQECEVLMNKMIIFSEQMLTKYGEFYPYGSVMNNDQTIRAISYYDGNEKLQSQELIDNYIKLYKELAQKGEIKASAIIWDAKINSLEKNEKIDAVIVSLEHRDNYSVQVVFPYKMIKGKIIWEEVFAMKGLSNIF